MTQMAKLLNLSRSRFYQLISEGVLLSPVYSLDKRRPFYTDEMASRNIEVKRTNIGVNKQICIFYSAKNKTTNTTPSKTRMKAKKQSFQSRHDDLIDALEGLGLENITNNQIDTALSESFPDGIDNVENDEILKMLFLSIKRQNSEHKQRT